MRLNDRAGHRFGRLVAERITARDPCVIYECRCDCGSRTSVRAGNLTSGHTLSCGCLQRERASCAKKTHGMHASKEYMVWHGMLARCTRSTNPGFQRYGGRGIAVCERWRSFENFFADMGAAPAGLTIERKDNSGPYAPWNCVWASRREQANNRRTNRMIECRGRVATLADWSRETGIRRGTIAYRLGAGWSADSALGMVR
jgi:hypothetical protein